MKIIIRIMKICPLTSMICATLIGLTIYGGIGMLAGVYEKNLSLTHPVFASVMMGEYAKETKPELETPVKKVQKSKTVQEQTVKQKDAQNPAKETQKEKTDGYETKFETVPMREARSSYYSDNDQIALSTEYPYVNVKKSYFDDAAFIGDSRIEGLHDYSKLNNADYFYKEGLTVYDLMTERLANGSTLKASLQKKQYHKIYIMIGINELGLKRTNDFKKQYKKNIKAIKKLQPDAVITILGIMHVTKKYSDNTKVFNNDNIDDKNQAIARLANGKDVFYLDMNPCISDKHNAVKEHYTWDGVHLKAEYIDKWTKFMKHHGLGKDVLF